MRKLLRENRILRFAMNANSDYGYAVFINATSTQSRFSVQG